MVIADIWNMVLEDNGTLSLEMIHMYGPYILGIALAVIIRLPI